jgi:hypothetical protein
MTIGWGWKIAMGYLGFVAMIICLVVASGRQKIDLVSKDYYKDEIAYQQVLDASKNQADLQGALTIHANKQEVVIDFPPEFDQKILSGNVQFYCAVNDKWDRKFDIKTTNARHSISRDGLHPATYTAKVNYRVDDKDFYYEIPINLSAL